MNKTNLWLSRCAVWVALGLALPVICLAETYSYDVTGRLTCVNYDDGSSIIYSYDANSNILSQIMPPDSDGDGLSDILETSSCTDVYDVDTDDDGIEDGIEDVNRNGVFDDGEMDACNRDTDGDSIQDGTEMGYTLDDIGPDTDTNFFQPDLDSSATTNPLNNDTDADGLLDNEEDLNCNGRVDQGEKDPNMSDLTIMYIDFNGSCNDNTPCYSTIQTGIDFATETNLLKLTKGIYFEDVLLDEPKKVSLQGGWNSDYSNNVESQSTIRGSMTITSGKVIVEGIVIDATSSLVKNQKPKFSYWVPEYRFR